MTFPAARSYFEGYLVSRRYAEETRKRYGRELRDFLSYCREERALADVREIGRDHVLAYEKAIFRARRSDGRPRYSPRTQGGILSALRVFFRALVRDEKILLDPFEGLELRRRPRYEERRILTEDQMDRLLDSLNEGDPLQVRDRALFELAYGTGLRCGELVGLSLVDLDLGSGRLLVRNGKGGRRRYVPVAGGAAECLRRYLRFSRPVLAERSGGLEREAVFLSSGGRRLGRNAVASALRRRLRRAGVPTEGISPHVLRHSFATAMLSGGAGVKQVAEVLGHKSIETTTRYTHFSIGDLRRILTRYHPRENELWEPVEIDLEEILRLPD